MKKPLTVATLVMGIGAVFVLIFSFLDWYPTVNAWGGDFGSLFPASIIPVILAVAMIVFIVLDLVGVKLPEKLLTFTWPQVYATWGISAGGIMLGWLLTGEQRKAGLFLCTIGALAMAAGSIMGLLGVGANTVNIPTGGSTPPQAPGYPPQAPGYPPQAPGYPPQAPGYPPQAPGYPPQAPPPPPPGAGSPPPPPPPA